MLLFEGHLSEEDIETLANMHMNIGDSFTSSLGPVFVKRYWRFIETSDLEFLFIHRDPHSNRIVSCLAVTLDKSSLQKRVLLKTLPYSVFWAVIRLFSSQYFRKLLFYVLKRIFSSENDDESPEIVFLYTNPEARQQQIAEKLLCQAESYLVEKNLTVLYTQTVDHPDGKSIDFYKKKGFIISNHSDLGVFQLVTLKKILSPESSSGNHPEKPLKIMVSQPMETEKVHVSLILPTYDEGANIVPLMERLEASLGDQWSYELIVVDDDSPDGTADKAREYGHNNPAIRVIQRKNERGLTSAINCGLKASRGRIVGWMDCDLCHPPELIATMLKELEADGAGLHAVIASRFVAGGGDRRSGLYRLQRILSLILSYLSQWITHLPVKDISSGYIVMRRSCFDVHGFLVGNYGEYFIDLIYKMQKNGLVMKEIPYIFSNRQYGESKTAVSLSDFLLKGPDYIRMLFKYRLGR
ncbi:MAG: GNAT family N-acetyltransferase [Nitrospirae bacterium]|nr:GNAT family N-acetyltransferase [Magnetococcales bacterium]